MVAGEQLNSSTVAKSSQGKDDEYVRGDREADVDASNQAIRFDQDEGKRLSRLR